MFLFRLAEHLGKTVGELLRNMSALELAYWRAKRRIDGPFLCERVDRLAAENLAWEAAWRTGEPQTPDDYLPPWHEREPEPMQTIEEMKATATAEGAVRKRSNG